MMIDTGTVSDDGGREDEILGSYRRFKDARRTARESLLGDDPSAYHLYVEGRLSQGHDYSLQSRGVVKYRNDEEDDPRGDTDFCIYAVDLEGRLYCICCRAIPFADAPCRQATTRPSEWKKAHFTPACQMATIKCDTTRARLQKRQSHGSKRKKTRPFKRVERTQNCQAVSQISRER